MKSIGLITVVFATALTACMAGQAPDGDDTAGDDAGDDTAGDDGGGDDGSGGFSPADFVMAFAEEECTMAHSCSASFPPDAGVTFQQAFGATIAECVLLANDYYQPAAVVAAVNDGTINYNEASAESCIANIDWGTCSQFWTGQSPLPSACGQAMQGTISDGGTCVVDFECSSDASWCGDAGTCEPVN